MDFAGHNRRQDEFLFEPLFRVSQASVQRLLTFRQITRQFIRCRHGLGDCRFDVLTVCRLIHHQRLYVGNGATDFCKEH